MVQIHSVYIISKSGGLIFSHDNASNDTQIEKTFSYPLDFKVDFVNQRLSVVFGQRDGIRVGHALLAINGQSLNGRKLGEQDVLDDILANENNYPISIKFGFPRLTANEKIVLASMFHSMYAIAALQIVHGNRSGKGGLSQMSSGIETLETDNFRLHCFQTVTGVKFVIICDINSPNSFKDALLRRIYELYADFVLKNPFYSLDMPIRLTRLSTEKEWRFVIGPEYQNVKFNLL